MRGPKTKPAQLFSQAAGGTARQGCLTPGCVGVCRAAEVKQRTLDNIARVQKEKEEKARATMDKITVRVGRDSNPNPALDLR